MLTRVPFVTHTLFQWDSVLYANALERGFHVDTEIGSERPHPPGYVFYVLLAALVRLVASDSNGALVAIAVVASAGAVAVTYLLARRFAPRSIAAACALGLAASPLFWQQSEVGLPYTLLALLSATFAAAFRRARNTSASLVGLSLAFGLASGMRQDLPLLLGPLWVWALLRAPRAVRARAPAAAAVGCVAWLVPSAALSGGLGSYLAAVAGQTAHVSTTFSVATRGAAGLSQNLAFTLYSVWWGVAAFAVVLIIVGGARLLATRGRPGDQATFLALWIVPPIVIYVGLHIGDPGYVLSVLPGLFVLAATLLAASPRGAVVLSTGLVAANAVLFVLPVGQFSAPAIAAHDRSVSDRVTYVRARYLPSDVTVLAQYDYVLARYYLPEYRTLFFGDAPEVLTRDPVAVTLAPGSDAVVLFGVTPDPGPGLRRDPAPGAVGDALAALVAESDATLVAYDVEAARPR